jgi:hypothetical protein
MTSYQKMKLSKMHTSLPSFKCAQNGLKNILCCRKNDSTNKSLIWRKFRYRIELLINNFKFDTIRNLKIN